MIYRYQIQSKIKEHNDEAQRKKNNGYKGLSSSKTTDIYIFSPKEERKKKNLIRTNFFHAFVLI